jgi:hypothetical protein
MGQGTAAQPVTSVKVCSSGCPGRDGADVSFLREEREDVLGKGTSYFGQWPPHDPPHTRLGNVT